MSTLSSVAAQALQRKITSADYAPGSRLPSQRALAESLGISRTSLREAISMLEALGLVRSHPGKGVYVSERTPHSSDDVPRGPAGVTAESIFQLRYIVEPAAAALAARHGNTAVDELQETQGQLERALTRLDLVAAAEWDLEFHKRIARHSGNPSLAEVMQESRIKIGYSLRLPFANTQRVWETVDEHRAVIQAVATGDAEQARRAMQRHLLAAADRIGIRFEQP
ncbi:FadR/GntR family transcriptional regulator [Marinobacter bohaiensis]|uniref:FadR/GntR family transcriptional regulator n=1 Tax=Marinobacter bohaiensis TaxID=2201898 RepID=UPI000DADD194|nr:FCD domain-containing protein [Marinobacter bohaiensis]